MDIIQHSSIRNRCSDRVYVGKEQEMTREEAIDVLEKMKYPQKVNKNGFVISNVDIENEALDMAIQALSQEPQCTEHPCLGTLCRYYKEPCDDAISRDAALEAVKQAIYNHDSAIMRLTELPPVTHKSGKCKNCKYFEYDSVAKVDGVPLIVAHEICNKWGNGCKTSEDGYCYLFEAQERSDKE